MQCPMVVRLLMSISISHSKPFHPITLTLLWMYLIYTADSKTHANASSALYSVRTGLKRRVTCGRVEGLPCSAQGEYGYLCSTFIKYDISLPYFPEGCRMLNFSIMKMGT